MIEGMKIDLENKHKKEFNDLETEFYKHLVIQLEQQKHNLFTKYQNRYRNVEKEYEGKLSTATAELRNAYNIKLAELVSMSEEYRSARLGELQKLSERAGALSIMLEHAVSAQERSKQVWELSLCLLDVQDAIKSTTPFLPQWERLLDASKGDAVLEQAITSVPLEIVASGIQTKDHLTSRFFAKVESAAREAALIDKAKPAKDGAAHATIWGYLLAKITSSVLIPQRAYIEGNEPENIISRAGYHMSVGDLEGCAKELDALDGIASDVTRDWVTAVKDRLLLEQTVDLVKTRMAHLDVAPLKFVKESK